MNTVDSEFMDGSCGHSEHASLAEAEDLARSFAAENPTARVWLNEEIIQHGYLASDDYQP